MDDESLPDLADMAHTYYTMLLDRGIPLSLAERMAGDWHQTALTFAAQWLIHQRDEKARNAAHLLNRRVVRP